MGKLINREDIKNDYFKWLYRLVCEDRFAKDISYKKLLMHLHNTEFRYSISRDENRARDGIDMRSRFINNSFYDPDFDMPYLKGPCSVLEMMVGLSVRCEETIMDNPQIGDRTGQWFWGMIASLGLNGMYDQNYDRDIAEETIQRFLDRDYAPNGKGGLFTIRDCNRDLRRVEIWFQMCWYLDGFVG